MNKSTQLKHKAKMKPPQRPFLFLWMKHDDKGGDKEA